MTRHPCWRCAQRFPGGRSLLCNDCHALLRAAGQRWCHGCRRALPAAEFGRSESNCFACKNAWQRAWRARSPKWAARLVEARERYATDPAYRKERKESARIAARSRSRRAR